MTKRKEKTNNNTGGENITKKEMTLLFIKFLKIKKKGWIKSQRKGTTGIGYTFERLIGKQEENLPIADFYNIEIKVKKKYSKGDITLFTANPDNEVYAIKRIYDTYGTCNKNKNYFKTFAINVSVNNYSKKGKHFFKLRVDYDNKVIRLQVFDLNKHLIEENISWSFELINEKIKYKIKNLSIIKAEVKKDIFENEYFYYYHIDFYEIIDDETFIKQIENGIITILFNISVYMDTKKYGNVYNHGTSFRIKIFDIEKLHNKKDFKKNN